MRDYKEPKNVTRYSIIEFNNHGDIYYAIKCFYNEKQYVFWGPIIEKSQMLKCHYFNGRKEIYNTAYFRTLSEAQGELNALCTGFSSRVVKEIEKRNHDC